MEVCQEQTPDKKDALLRATILSGEDWLMERILHYAHRQQYTQYTSTLICAWRLSIAGLSEALVASEHLQSLAPVEFTPDMSFGGNPMTSFAVDEAIAHRRRGIKLGMFLGLLKYYRQSYLDLIDERLADSPDLELYRQVVLRRFDLFDIALVSEWNSTPQDTIIEELSNANREITNEKNFYLTAYESLVDPAFLVDETLRVISLNHAAESLLANEFVPAGERYYRTQIATAGKTLADPGTALPGTSCAGDPIGKSITELVPELIPVLSLSPAISTARHSETAVTIHGEPFEFMVSQCPMQDVSGKFRGSVVFLSDISDRKIMEDELRDLAQHDPLTGAANRRRLYSVAETEIVRARRLHAPLCAVAMDIDHFKNINDEHGHHAGDVALREVSALIMRSLRAYDTFARMGGEEFTLLLPQTDIDQAQHIAERMRQSIAATPIVVADLSLTINMSMGVAALQDAPSTIDDLLQAADTALYQAKSSGRNRVCRAQC